MDIQLMKQLGNMEQIAGIRESVLARGRSKGVNLATFYNAAGLEFSVVPDRCMDIYDFRYKGINFAFLSKNGLTPPITPMNDPGLFTRHWQGGMMVTCGLDNVGLGCLNCPTHGSITDTPAVQFGTESRWEKDEYVLRASGTVQDTLLYGRNLTLHRTIETGLHRRSVTMTDVITNHDCAPQPYQLLYHFNFGYPLLQADTKAAFTQASVQPVTDIFTGHRTMLPPEDSRSEELYLHTGLPGKACGFLYNETLGLGAYVRWDTTHLPQMFQWKLMKSHDYVAAFEPCNNGGLNREQALAEKSIATVPPYSHIELYLELGVLDGMDEIQKFLADNDCR